MSDLPTGWAETTLSTVASITTGNTPSTKNPELYGGSVPFAKPGDLDTRAPITSTEQCLSEEGASQARLLRTGAVLVSCIGNLGKVGIAGTSLATNQQINSAEFYPFIVDDRYGYYVCKTLKPWMEREASATTIAILNKGRFSEAPFPLAPLPEQKRIADKLDSVLARVDACRDRLDRLPALLKRFRQSILAAATSGKLTEDWRELNLAEKDWNATKLENLCTSVFDGPFGSNLKSDDYTTSGVRVVRLENIGHLYFEASKETYISDEKYQGLVKHSLQPDDILFSSFVDEEVRVCLYPTKLPTAAINKADCFCLRPDASKCMPTYLSYRLASRATYVELKELVHGATRPRINLKQLRQYLVELPELEEQTEIVRRVEILFAFADRLEARLASARRQVGQLTPALLAKAFRGELVPQDPADEPASELLKRLAAQREAAPKAKRGRSKA